MQSETFSMPFVSNNYSLPKPPKISYKRKVTKNKKSSLDQWNSIDMTEQFDQIPSQFLDPSVPLGASHIFVDKQQSAQRRGDVTDVSDYL